MPLHRSILPPLVRPAEPALGRRVISEVTLEGFGAEALLSAAFPGTAWGFFSAVLRDFVALFSLLSPSFIGRGRSCLAGRLIDLILRRGRLAAGRGG